MRVAVLGGDDVRAAVLALGFEVAEVERAQVAIVDARDRAQLASASALPHAMPRLTVISPDDAPFFAALGIDGARVVSSAEPARIGPALVALAPTAARGATRVVLVAGVRGGVGRTLLVANLARRIAKRLRVCAIDATGSGALAWWLGASPKPWTEIEAIAAELTPEHLAVVGDAQTGPRVIGGPPAAPSASSLDAVVRVACVADDVVLIDAPPSPDALTRALAARADRRLILAYDDPWSALLLDADPPQERDWLLASQSKSARVARHETFRALPRDEAAVSAAASARSTVGGALGRVYDELAELITIDATEA